MSQVEEQEKMIIKKYYSQVTGKKWAASIAEEEEADETASDHGEESKVTKI